MADQVIYKKVLRAGFPGFAKMYYKSSNFYGKRKFTNKQSMAATFTTHGALLFAEQLKKEFKINFHITTKQHENTISY